MQSFSPLKSWYDIKKMDGWCTSLCLIGWKMCGADVPKLCSTYHRCYVWTHFRGQLTDEIKNKIHRLKSELVFIPMGMTSVLQPLDVSVNKPFKARLSKQYNRWILDLDRELMASGKIKCAAPHVVAHWVSSAWTSIPANWLQNPSRSIAFLIH